MFYTYRKVLVIAAIIFSVFSFAFAYSGGSGEPNDPYQIATVSDWNDLMNTSADWNKNFIMTADVNLQGISLTPVGNDYYNSFTGVFDGNGHTIRNVDINMPTSEYVGLFGFVGVGGQIRNLGVEDVEINGQYNVGGLVGNNWGGTITNCYATGTVSGGNATGGLVGENTEGIITACYTTGVINGSRSVGGLVGFNLDSTITNCYTAGMVNGSSNIGGLIGWNYNGCITTSYAVGSVSGYSVVGGLVGSNFGCEGIGIIRVCYATVAVSGNNFVGGLVGSNNAGDIITDCYAIGAVDGNNYVGGLVGENNRGIVTASFWDVNTSGWSTSAGGEGKTTEEMQTLSTLTSVGWDFSYTDGDEADWFIQIDEYPILVWQISPADIYTDGRNNFRDFAVFAQYWMRNDCRIYNDYCDWADLNFDGSVDADDLIELMSYWLQSGIYE